MAYSPKYVDTTEIPVQIPDDYSDQEKLDALEYAETVAELDLFNGEEIRPELQSSRLTAAIKQKATCELAKGSEHPDDVALGDLDDTGSTKVDYSTEAFCERYEELVDAILDAGGIDPDGDGDDSRAPFTYTTRESEEDDPSDNYYTNY